MSPRLAIVAALLLVASNSRAQGVDANMQNLLAGLENGTEVRLVTPLAGGLLQVTNFRPSMRLSAAEAATYVERARLELGAVGEPRPTTEQIARMLAGGPIDVPAGRIYPRGLLTGAGAPVLITSQIIPQNAAVGGSAPAYGTR